MDGCPSTPMGANIGIISDKGFTALYGSCEAVELEVESLMNLVNALYTDMTNLQLAVVYLVCNGAGSGDNFEAEGPNDEPLFFGQRARGGTTTAAAVVSRAQSRRTRTAARAS